jgi:hypothetical protein
MTTKDTFSFLQKFLLFGFFLAAIYVNYNIMPSNFHNSPDISYISKIFKKVILLTLV